MLLHVLLSNSVAPPSIIQVDATNERDRDTRSGERTYPTKPPSAPIAIWRPFTEMAGRCALSDADKPRAATRSRCAASLDVGPAEPGWCWSASAANWSVEGGGRRHSSRAAPVEAACVPIVQVDARLSTRSHPPTWRTRMNLGHHLDSEDFIRVIRNVGRYCPTVYRGRSGPPSIAAGPLRNVCPRRHLCAIASEDGRRSIRRSYTAFAGLRASITLQCQRWPARPLSSNSPSRRFM